MMRLASILRTATSALALLAAAGAAHAQGITLRVADVYPVGHYIAEALVKPWMDDVRHRLGEQVAFQYFPAEQLGHGKELLGFTQSGVVDVGLVIPSFVPDQLPLSAVAELPGSFSTACKGARAFWSLAHGGLLDKDEFAPNKVRVLMATVLPPYQIMSHREIADLKSFAGQKLYSTGGAKDITLRRLGAVPTHMTTAEVYSSLSRGTIDGALVAYATGIAYRLPGLVKYATMGENFGSGVITYTISTATWEKLPEAVRSAMDQAGEAATLHACESFDHGVDADMAKLKQDGVALVQLPDADHAAIAQEMRGVADDWAAELDKRGKPGSAVLSAFRDALAKQ